ncbi:hypothetical protein LNV08_20945 [Paucibacter sp. TC2R-5]|uniref:hypothetical protein n=1 Tax=Paucibacter sp. TC2R-5 TaxID=2893555 RepID=UPI0021E4A784|nr:hypothetical protein [Paucibacter sp. TC2R-5]MCV2361436.1 hypothetical protein [Paucibacter sp. TC2R-5]
MLLTLMGQLRSNHFCNGRIDAHPSTMLAYGWRSVSSARAALKELMDADLVVCTRQGHKGSIGLYGITLFPMHCEPKGLDVGPGAWTVSDWRNRKGSDCKPTKDQPAKWNRPRSGEKQNRQSRSGNGKGLSAPAAGMNPPEPAPCVPAAGAHWAISGGNAFPLRDSPLREAIYQQRQQSDSSLPAHLTRLGRLLIRRIAHGRQPGYSQARA